MKKLLLILTSILIIGLLLPEDLQIPVKGASKKDWNPKSFWYYPWGKSITHKGIDIFAPKGRLLKAPTYGIVLYTGKVKYGGNIVLTLGPKWRIHYMAHLQSTSVKTGQWLTHNKIIGKVGTTGNAVGKAPHLHYSVVTLLPYPWRIDNSQQAWRKMFYLNPATLFSQQQTK